MIVSLLIDRPKLFRVVRKFLLSGSWLLLLTAFFFGCQKEHQNPLASYYQTLPIPQNIQVRIEPGCLFLTWDYPDSLIIENFRVLRQDSNATRMATIGLTARRQFNDSTMLTGQTYAYAIQACATNGKFSPLSAPVYVTAGNYGIRLENGQSYTRQSTIQLTLLAPVGTTALCLANDRPENFSDWEPFTTTRQWTLSPGDGQKSVWVRFQNQWGQNTEPAFGDSIWLDRQAEIEWLRENSQGRLLKFGDTLTVMLNAKETNGQAMISLGNWRSNVLNDAGVAGDEQANDGIYSQQLIIPDGIEVNTQPIIGNFSDQAGNQVTARSLNLLSIQNPPSPVQLFLPVRLSAQSIRLNWTRNHDSDFYGYHVIAATQPNLTENANPDTIILQRQVTTHRFSNLAAAQTYYFRIVVLDSFGLRSMSNEVSLATGSENPVASVWLFEPQNVTPNAVTLNWSVAHLENFQKYQVWRWERTYDEGEHPVATEISDQEIHTWRETSLKPNVRYFYQVVVFSWDGRLTQSNLVTALTIVDEPPQPVVLALPSAISQNSIRLSWTQNRDADFAAYYMLRSERSPVETQLTPIGIINNASTTEFVDLGLTAGKTYYYKILVFDQRQQFAASNEVVIRFQP
ncbi:fibronectin type III domain-containing protein [candidate division KSB1 bacterium]|nr:fibronectin type III domain-containing protein [candidate division KSB1 bacterium]